ncbi:MAG: hypothetical protein ACE5PV_09440 [Candidatus Poribacteria bacterium]
MQDFERLIDEYKSDNKNIPPDLVSAFTELVPLVKEFQYLEAKQYNLAYNEDKRMKREMVKEYINEKQSETGRPKVVRLLNKYQGYLYFCCSTVPSSIPIESVEEALLKAFLPPCNDQFPAEVSRVIGAFQ